MFAPGVELAARSREQSGPRRRAGGRGRARVGAPSSAVSPHLLRVSAESFLLPFLVSLGCVAGEDSSRAGPAARLLSSLQTSSGASALICRTPGPPLRGPGSPPGF